MKHARSATSPSPRLVNPHHLRSLCDCADVFPRLLEGGMTQRKLLLSASLAPGSALSPVNCGNLNTVWLHRWGQNTGGIIAVLCCVSWMERFPSLFLSDVPPQHHQTGAEAPLHCTSLIDGMASWSCLIIFHHWENTESLLWIWSRSWAYQPFI